MPQPSEHKIVLGVDFGATKIQVGAITCAGEFLSAKKFPTNRNSQEESVASLQNAISSFLKEWDGPTPAAIGVGLVGDIDWINGIWVHSMNAKISDPVPIVEILEQKFSLPVFIDNDVNCAAIAENYFGVGRVSKNFILINVGTGIACGIVDEGRLIRGISNSAGEMGHCCVETDGELCSCGYFGCLENIVGGGALIRSAEKMLPRYPESALNALHSNGELHSNSIFEAAQAGDQLAAAIAKRATKALGIAVVNLVNLLNPEYIVFAGSVMRNEWFLEQIRKFVYDNTMVVVLNHIKGITTSFTNVGDVGTHGAACLCISPDGHLRKKGIRGLSNSPNQNSEQHAGAPCICRGAER